MDDIALENLPEAERIQLLQDLYDGEHFPASFANWSIEDRDAWILKRAKALGCRIPKSLERLLTGLTRPGDCQRPLTDVPTWLDEEAFERGQKFAQDHFFGLTISSLLGIILAYTFKESTQPLIMTHKTDTPFEAFKRYTSTTRRAKLWYTEAPWKPGTESHKTTKYVRYHHTRMRKILEGQTREEFERSTEIPKPCSPARHILLEDFRAGIEEPNLWTRPYTFIYESLKRPTLLTQTEMAGVQFAFMGLPLLSPELCGLGSVTDQQLSDFCHVWRAIAYSLGIEDHMNFAEGTLDEVKQRSRDLLDCWIKPNLREITPEWEHMAWCACEGIALFVPLMTYESMLLYLMETILEIPMPRLRASMSYRSIFLYYLTRFTMFLCKVPGCMFVVNKIFGNLVERTANLDTKALKRLQNLSDQLTAKVLINA